MSLVIQTDVITPKQIAWLREHGYYGNLSLTKQSANELIEEYIEQERLTLTTRHRGFLDRLAEYDPQYIERYRDIKLMGRE